MDSGPPLHVEQPVFLTSQRTHLRVILEANHLICPLVLDTFAMKDLWHSVEEPVVPVLSLLKGIVCWHPSSKHK